MGVGGRWLEDHWTEQRICQNKVIASGQNRVAASTLQRLSSSGPTSGLTHTASPWRGWHGRRGGQLHTWACTCAPPRPTGSYTACRGTVSYANPAHPEQASSHPLWRSPGSPGRDTYSYPCFYVTRPHTTIPKANNQQKVSDYLLCSGSCPAEILASVMEIKLL